MKALAIAATIEAAFIICMLFVGWKHATILFGTGATLVSVFAAGFFFAKRQM